MLPEQTKVLIVGAGPTGLALAITLQQAGVDYLLVQTNWPFETLVLGYMEQRGLVE